MGARKLIEALAYRFCKSRKRSPKRKVGKLVSKSSSTLVSLNSVSVSVRCSKSDTVPNRQNITRCEYGRILQHRREGFHCVYGYKGMASYCFKTSSASR